MSGTIIRSAGAAGASAVICCDGSVDVYNPKTVRASAGMLFHVPVVVGGDAAGGARRSSGPLGPDAAGEPVPAAGVTTPRSTWPRPIALVLGNEAHGLADLVTTALDGTVEHSDGRAGGVDQRGDGGGRGVLRGGPAASSAEGPVAAVTDLDLLPDAVIAARRGSPDHRRQRRRLPSDRLPPTRARRPALRQRLRPRDGAGAARLGRTGGTDRRAFCDRSRPSPSRPSPCAGAMGADVDSRRHRLRTSATPDGAVTGAVLVPAYCGPAAHHGSERHRGRLDGRAMSCVRPLPPSRATPACCSTGGTGWRTQQKRMMLEQVNHDADRVTRLITELLDISRLETRAGCLLRRQLVDLPRAGGRGDRRRLGLEYPALDAECEFPGRFPQGVRRSRQGGAGPDQPGRERLQVRLPARAPSSRAPCAEDAVSVAVTDQGEGIPPSDLPRVFTKFFRRDGRATARVRPRAVDQPGPGRVAWRPSGGRIKLDRAGRHLSVYPSLIDQLPDRLQEL